MASGTWVTYEDEPAFGEFDPETIRQTVMAINRAATGTVNWMMDHPYVANGIAIVASLILIGGVGLLIRAAILRHYTPITGWRRQGENMPHGTEDDHATAVAASAIYDTLFDLAINKKISWKKEAALTAKIAHAIGAQNLVPIKTHRGAIKGRVKKNVAAMRHTPNVSDKLPSPAAEPALKFLRK